MSSFFASFFEKVAQIGLATTAPPGKNTGGRPPRMSRQHLIAGLAWHVMQPAGTFAHSIFMALGIQMSESALSERRQSLGSKPWIAMLETFLKPHATPAAAPQAFYHGYRLIGIDGTTQNVANTPPMKATTTKTKTRKGRAAFTRIGCVATVELGTHTPIAVRIGENGEPEGVLAAAIADTFRTNDLVIGDRYYGNGKWAARLLGIPQQPKFLLRVREYLKEREVKKCRDGSIIVLIKDPDSGKDIQLRQIKARVRRIHGKKQWVNVRFWTNLMDPVLYPAKDLVMLYLVRWEQEIAFYEFKEYLHGENLLLSHTMVTAVQEICALFMAQSIIAKSRLSAANSQNIPVLQISFKKTLDACRNMSWLMAIAGKIMSKRTILMIAKAVEKSLGMQASKPRRHRSCPRKVRQPINKWHRLFRNRYNKGKFTYEIRKS